MMPGYNDSSQPCQMRPQGYYYHQGFRNNHPHHMTMEAPSPPCQGSCLHGNFPAYNAYWPPCYPPPQVPYHQCCMNHSGFHPHASYAPPPPPCYIHPPYPAGYQPWYGTEKDTSGEHPCGNCSPQVCYPKNERGVVIEEHEPDTQKGSRGEAVRGPYSTIWIPHENAKNQEHGSSSLGSENREVPRAEVKAPENMAVQKFFPNPWNGCFPFDENTVKSVLQNQNQDRKKAQNGKTVEIPFDFSKLKSLFEGQDVKEAQIQKNKEEPGQLQYPLFWIPSNGKREDVEASARKESSNEVRNLKSFSSDHHGNEGRKPQNVPSGFHRNADPKPQNEGREGNFDSNVVVPDAEKKISLRSIPVAVENHLQERRNIPVKLAEKPTEPTKTIAKKTEPVGNTKREQLSSPPKASRLPPVCLRVDPLPNRKNSGAKSLNSPKRKEQPLKSGETKVISQLSSKKTETKTVPETSHVKHEEANKEKKMNGGPINSTGTEKESSVERDSNLQGKANCEIVNPCETKENEVKPAKKTFTEEEAVKIIQSRFRGYDVRRWEPIKKLKEIATVLEQMGDIKKRIQALEVSNDQHIEEKEIVILGEMVMNLLLKLDSVQGLHPSIRDHRKSLARELSEIEDKLDSMKICSAIAEKETVEKQVEITSQNKDCPVNLEHTQLAEENKMVPETNTEEILLLSPEEHPSSDSIRTDESPVAETEEGFGLFETLATNPEPATKPINPLSGEPREEIHLPFPEDHPLSDLNRTDEQLALEAEDGSGLFETLATDPELPTESSICERANTSTTDSEKIEEVETVQPINPLSTEGGEETTVTKMEEDKAVMKSLEEPQNELPQLVEKENAIEGSETEASVLENADRKGEYDTILPSEEHVELSEIPPVGVAEDETQVLSQDSAVNTAMELETTSREETNIELSSDHSKDLAKETTSEPQEETKQPKVTGREVPEETKRLMEENQQFKETMETLLKAGREQLEVISKLTGRVKSLEKKLSQQKKKKRTQIGVRKPSHVKDATKPKSASSTDAVLYL